jgi:hypothetical protein
MAIPSQRCEKIDITSLKPRVEQFTETRFCSHLSEKPVFGFPARWSEHICKLADLPFPIEILRLRVLGN